MFVYISNAARDCMERPIAIWIKENKRVSDVSGTSTINDPSGGFDVCAQHHFRPENEFLKVLWHVCCIPHLWYLEIFE